MKIEKTYCDFCRTDITEGKQYKLMMYRKNTPPRVEKDFCTKCFGEFIEVNKLIDQLDESTNDA